MTTNAELQIWISGLVSQAISGDVLSGEDGDWLMAMGGKDVDVQHDIPRAYEMVTLLGYYAQSLPVHEHDLDHVSSPIALNPSISIDRAKGKLLLLAHIEAGDLPYIAHWVADAVPSEHIKRKPGILAVPFQIQVFDDKERLMPDWFSAFYVNASSEHCIPIFALRSIGNCDQFGGDWVDMALHRMTAYRLPQKQAAYGAASFKASDYGI